MADGEKDVGVFPHKAVEHLGQEVFSRRARRLQGKVDMQIQLGQSLGLVPQLYIPLGNCEECPAGGRENDLPSTL